MEAARGTSEFQLISKKFAAAKKQPREVLTKVNSTEKASQFETLHLRTLAFFSWLLYVFPIHGSEGNANEISLLHVAGIYFFTRGFLLTRLVLDHKSECTSAPLTIPGHQQGSYVNGCWYPRSFDKAVIIIIDALRYDFTVPYDAKPSHFHNVLSIFHETALETPQNAFLLPFIADPPTSTLQRLKGLTTGTLPTFIDVGSSFSGTAIEEDNLVDQLRKANKVLVHLGDDTWHSLFPGYFDVNLTHAYDSFNVWDLHTVDNGVTEHLLPLLHPDNTTKWDVLFGHYLGVDHAGHRYGPDHPAMTAKLQEMDQVFRNVVKSLDGNTLLVVMGDHGMDVKGDHGGESDDEVEAALWMYSKKGIFGRSQSEFRKPPKTAKERSVWQIDLVPTLSLLLGMPIPFNNLGAPIEEAFIGRNGLGWSNLASVNALIGAQIRNYQHEYAIARGLDVSATSEAQMLWNQANETWQQFSTSRKRDIDLSKSASVKFANYQELNLSVCRDLWARFDVPSMILGIAILFIALITLYFFARCSQGNSVENVPELLQSVSKWSVAGFAIGGVISMALPLAPFLDVSLFCTIWGSISGYIYTSEGILHVIPFPISLWGALAFIFTIAQSIGFASNSYTIWEDEIMLFFLNTFALVTLVSSLRQENTPDRILGTYQSTLFLFLTRLASLSRLCREEQMPSCRSTYYASATSSTSATWHLFIPFALAIILPSIIKSHYQGTRSYEGSAVFWIGFAFRIGLLGSAMYWTIDASDDGDWFGVGSERLQTIKVVMAQIILGLAFAAGTTTYVWARPCVRVETIPASNGAVKTNTAPRAKSITILGFANVHGSRYFLLFSNWALAVILLQRPMGGGAIGLMTWQILALLEIVDTNDLSQSAIGPVVLGLLGSFYFFKTGHQATLSSIQWGSAFVALKTIRYPWSPLLVTLNTFGAQILAVVAVPLLVLWKKPPKKRGLLGDVVKSLATFLCYHAVINLATTMWAGYLRRHLMLYRIFSPRFLTGATVLLVVDIVGILVALGGVRWNIIAIADIFGWE